MTDLKRHWKTVQKQLDQLGKQAQAGRAARRASG